MRNEREKNGHLPPIDWFKSKMDLRALIKLVNGEVINAHFHSAQTLQSDQINCIYQ